MIGGYYQVLLQLVPPFVDESCEAACSKDLIFQLLQLAGGKEGGQEPGVSSPGSFRSRLELPGVA